MRIQLNNRNRNREILEIREIREIREIESFAIPTALHKYLSEKKQLQLAMSSQSIVKSGGKGRMGTEEEDS